MRDHGDPYKWPFALGLSLVLTTSLFFVVPWTWLGLLFPDADLEPDSEPEPTPWLSLLPPPEVLVTPEPPKAMVPRDEPPPPREDPRWWSEGWKIRVEEESRTLMVPAVLDSVTYLLSALGVGQDLLTQARPDSLLASRLAFMQLEDSFRFDELKPYLGAMTRAAAYADIMSRAADMYDDFLQSEIMVPD
jgi:hypothetical protein